MDCVDPSAKAHRLSPSRQVVPTPQAAERRIDFKRKVSRNPLFSPLIAVHSRTGLPFAPVCACTSARRLPCRRGHAPRHRHCESSTSAAAALSSPRSSDGRAGKRAAGRGANGPQPIEGDIGMSPSDGATGAAAQARQMIGMPRKCHSRFINQIHESRAKLPCQSSSFWATTCLPPEHRLWLRVRLRN